MRLDECEMHWRQLAEEVLLGMKEWRLQHPKATLVEIEAALDERWAKARARILQDVVMTSAAADLPATPLADRPRCLACGAPLEARGPQPRDLTTYYQQTVHLERTYAVCPSCGTGLFPPG